MHQHAVHTIFIEAARAVVWECLTSPPLMAQWMGEPDMEIDVQTDWTVGSPMVIHGVHHVRFSNLGTVLQFEPTTHIRYSHLSSLSKLSDTPENHSIVDIELTTVGIGTSVVVTVSGFPNDVIFKHLDFYWRGTASALKRLVEGR